MTPLGRRRGGRRPAALAAALALGAALVVTQSGRRPFQRWDDVFHPCEGEPSRFPNLRRDKVGVAEGPRISSWCKSSQLVALRAPSVRADAWPWPTTFMASRVAVSFSRCAEPDTSLTSLVALDTTGVLFIATGSTTSLLWSFFWMARGPCRETFSTELRRWCGCGLR